MSTYSRSLCGDGDGSDDDVASGAKGSARRASTRFTSGGMGENIDEARLSHAKQSVNKAMNADPELAMRFQFMVEKQILKCKKNKQTGDNAMLPGCGNKYHLMGRERSVELMMFLSPECELPTLKLMKKFDLDELLDYSLALARPCAIPSKVWGQVKAIAKTRYAELGAPRLTPLKFLQKGDAKAPYTEVDWQNSGCYTANRKTSKGKKFIVSLTHVSGTTVKVAPPLDDSYQIVRNNNDRTATLVSLEAVGEFLCLKVFEKSNNGHCIPQLLNDERVGQASPNKPPQDLDDQDQVLALTDLPKEDIPALSCSPASPPMRDRASSASSRLPAGSASGMPPAKKPRKN